MLHGGSIALVAPAVAHLRGNLGYDPNDVLTGWLFAPSPPPPACSWRIERGINQYVLHKYMLTCEEKPLVCHTDSECGSRG